MKVEWPNRVSGTCKEARPAISLTAAYTKHEAVEHPAVL